jgi:hypothetical protein
LPRSYGPRSVSLEKLDVTMADVTLGSHTIDSSIESLSTISRLGLFVDIAKARSPEEIHFRYRLLFCSIEVFTDVSIVLIFSLRRI